MYTESLFEREKIATLNLLEIKQALREGEAAILVGPRTPSRHGREWQPHMSPSAMRRVSQCRNI